MAKVRGARQGLFARSIGHLSTSLREMARLLTSRVDGVQILARQGGLGRLQGRNARRTLASLRSRGPSPRGKLRTALRVLYKVLTHAMSGPA